jgi:hypothetical protein
LSHRYCYLPLSWKSWNWSSNSSTTAAGSTNDVTNTRCCRLLLFFLTYALQPSRLIVRSGLDVPTFVSPRENTQRPKVELWARNVREFCLNVDFHATFRDLLPAVKLRHGTDGFTSPPKEGVLRIFSP